MRKLDSRQRVQAVARERLINVHTAGAKAELRGHLRRQPRLNSVLAQRPSLGVQRLSRYVRRVGLFRQGRAPFGNRVERAFQEPLAGGAPLNFAARRFGNLARLDERDGVDLQLVFGGDRFADRFDRSLRVWPLTGVYLLNDY